MSHPAPPPPPQLQMPQAQTFTSSPTSGSSPTLPEIPVPQNVHHHPERSASVAFVDQDPTPTGNNNGEQITGVGAHGRLSRNASQLQIDTSRPHRSYDGHSDRPYSIRRQSTHISAGGIPPPHALGGTTSEIPTLVSERNGPRRTTVRDRLQPTIDNAEKQREKFAKKAKLTGWTLNIAIGLQVLLGSLTTGLSAVSSAGQFALSTAILGKVEQHIEVRKVITALGGLSTLIASYLARARGSNEPELSIARTKDLDNFIREVTSYVLDHGHLYGPTEDEVPTDKQKELDRTVHEYRSRFEDLLGNADGQRKMAPPV